MSVVTYVFLAFLAITLFIYYMVPKKMQWVVLLLASIGFYAYAGIKYLFIVLIEAAIVYFFTVAMQNKIDEQNERLKGLDRSAARKMKKGMKEERKKYLIIPLVTVILVLVVFKGTGFALKNLNRIVKHFTEGGLPVIHLIAPLGISFYTFMMISYLMDLFRGKITAERNFFKYLCYVLYFPHVTQGPIAVFDVVSPQLFAEHAFNYDTFCKGLWLMLWGFFKKLVIADNIAPFVTQVFHHSSHYKGQIFLLAGIMYSIQIYCDFSGCMDIVRGVSECFDIKLQENFIRPYFSQTLPEFWRRWHATLGAFFREYVFYPVSTAKFFLNLNNKAREKFGNDLGRNLASCVPILCVWLLTGVWHGCSWNYIGWGLFHGVMISLSTIFEQPLALLTTKLKINTKSKLWMIYRMLRTFFLCVIGRIIFMGKGFMHSLWMIKSSFTDFGYTYDLTGDKFISGKKWIVVLICSLLLLLVSIAQEICQQKGSTMTIRDWLAKRNIVIRWAVLLGAIMIILIFGTYGSGIGQTFIYDNF